MQWQRFATEWCIKHLEHDELFVASTLTDRTPLTLR